MAETLHITRQGQGTPLVFIHGWGLNSEIWQPCLPFFTEHFQVITVDLPGFASNSEVQLAEYSLENIAKAMVNAIPEPAIYLGWSLGGLCATQIALSFPEQVLALITVASSPQFVAKQDWPGIQPDVLAMFHQQLAQDAQKTINNFLKIQAMGSPHVRQDIKQIRELVMQHPLPTRQILDESLALLETSDLSSQLNTISVPMLRLYGKLDSLVPKAVIQQVDELAPQSQSIVFEQASHAPFISHQQTFVEQTLAWLSTQLTSA